MAKRVTRKSQEQILMHTWWVRGVLALAFVGVAYGFASLAIDSGNLLEYAITIVLVWWAVHHLVYAVRFVLAR